ncbi:hypothetical protein GCM10011369_07210 [Neiella marina]|uniref:Carbohydrate-binding protein n=1 Tax=Neiella marina TaxID=508461 RepID=A0A8J2XN00_9GAMM|nr:di-heme oxidoredictase family protein [Neiella marina]GGA68062.1 hypothetical protein GCM10011369_07210 [Neiella marina]
MNFEENSRTTERPFKAAVLALAVTGAISAPAWAGAGIEQVDADTGIIYFDDENWTGGWNYICLDSACNSGSLIDGRWQRTVSGLTEGQSYRIQLKIQDNSQGQYISPEEVVLFPTDSGGSTPVEPPTDPVDPPTDPVDPPTDPVDPPTDPVDPPTDPVDPPVAGEPVIVEAESGTILGSASVYSDGAAQGGSGVAYISSNGAGFRIDNAPASNQIVLSYASEQSGTISVYVDGVDNNVPFTGNGSWVGSYATASADLTIAAGATVEVRFDNGDSALNIDYVQFNTIDAPTDPVDPPTDPVDPGNPDNPDNPDSGNPGTPPAGKDAQVVAPSEIEALPVLDYGYTATAGTFLVGGLGVGNDLFGHTLYTFAPDVAYSGESNCVDCAAWPAVLVTDENDLIRPSRLVGDLDTISLPNGSMQVTYNGKPLYFRAADTLPGQTDGANQSWPLAVVETTPVPQELYQAALQTPSNMPLSANGFQFDIAGNNVTWAFGAVLDSVSADEVSFFCSVDQMSFFETDLTSGSATIPAQCLTGGDYWYFFRYKMNNPGAGKYVMDNTYDFDPDTAYRYTALFIDDGTRLDLRNRPDFKDVGANWMRFRHPRSYDGVTEAIRDATYNSSRLADLARYSLFATERTDSNGVIELEIDLNMPQSYTGNAEQGLVRLEGLQNGAGDAKLPTWQYNFEPSNNQTTYTQGDWSYGQTLSFEMTGVVGRITAQTYNTFQYYTFGLGFHSPIGDPRLSLVGKGGTHMVFNIKNYGGEFKNGHIGAGIHDMIMEKGALFTQHLTTLESPSEVDDFLWGHHLFHGVKIQRGIADDSSQDNLGSNPGDTGIGQELAAIKAGGPIACGDCHYRDGRGSDVIETPAGPRIAPPTYGVGLLQYIDGREAGFTWNGSVPTVRQQIKNALVNDHGIDPNDAAQISPENLELINKYTEYLTVPARFPGVYDKPGVAEGDALFHEVGCVSCHQPIQHTSAQAPKAFRSLTIRPYTDMKTHRVAGGTYRTAPLWGLGRNIDLLENNNKLVNGQIDIGIALYDGDDAAAMAEHHMRERALLFLHDGRASTLKEAILMHDDGEPDNDAAAVIDEFGKLSEADQDKIVQFLRSL